MNLLGALFLLANKMACTKPHLLLNKAKKTRLEHCKFRHKADVGAKPAKGRFVPQSRHLARKSTENA